MAGPTHLTIDKRIEQHSARRTAKCRGHFHEVADLFQSIPILDAKRGEMGEGKAIVVRHPIIVGLQTARPSW